MASWRRTQNSPEFETAELIVSGILPMVLIVIGTIGNLGAVLILLSKENRQISTNIYLIFLCVADTISLYQWNLNQAFTTFTHGQITIWGNSLIMCKLTRFFPNYALHASAMFLTFVELDRACLLRSAWYKTKISQPRVTILICILILILLCILNGFLFAFGYEYSIIDPQTGIEQTAMICYYSINPSINDFYNIQYPWIHIIVMYFLPLSVFILSTLLTIKKLLVKPVGINNQFENNARRNRRISVMLLFMCLIYFITTLPNRLCFTIFADAIIGHEYTDTIFLSSNTLMYSRCASNAFFLYISMLRFRRSVHKLVFKCFRKPRVQIHPANYIIRFKNKNIVSASQRNLVGVTIEKHGST